MTTDSGAANRSCGIAVMAKASAPGRVKTRLVPPLSHDEAAYLNTAFLQDVAGNLLATGRIVDMSGYMAFGPPGSESFFASILPHGIGLIEAWFPDFGDCLYAAIAQQLASGHEAACVLNSDSPTLATTLLVNAVETLLAPGDRVVLGPSSDGGYYLLGMKQAYRGLFENIDWSTERVARQTIERARQLGLETVVLPEWYDVDDAASLRLLADEVLAGLSHVAHELTSYPAPHATAWLKALLQDEGSVARLGIRLPASFHRHSQAAWTAPGVASGQDLPA